MYNVFIWIIALLPIVSVAAVSSLNVTQALTESASGTPGVYGPGEFITSFEGVIVYLVSVLLAYFDWRKLQRDGLSQPFHWAWSFLTVGVYVIGRSVIVKRRAGRGLWPIWVWAVISVAYMVVVIVKLIDAIPALIALVPELR